ncbi:MAG TPA: Holliday junction resolvase RuvX [Acidimicrobiales bacterium]|jgi:putative Holliday junction resolvase|nr:Holliday junction resolvase RuvX [Acidimicrobiales bacterium]
MTGDAPTRRGRALGVDLGSRRIGIAVTDSAGTMALPRTTLVRTGDVEGDRRRLVEMAVEDGVVVVVVGLPLSLDGSRGRAAMAAVEEAAVLRGLLEPRGIEVELFDERLTTVTAHQALAAGGADERGRRQIVDQAAAAVMLSAWLESSGARR